MLVGLVVVLAVPSAFARDSALTLEVQLAECPEVRQAEVQRILSAELGAQANDQDAREPTHVLARCDGAHVTLQISDPLSKKRLEREFDLGSAAPAARSRLLAIAAAELVLASWAELELTPVLRVEPAGQGVSFAERQSAIDRVRRHRAQTASGAATTELAATKALTGETEAPPNEPSWFELQQPDARMFRVAMLASVRSFSNHDGALWGGGLRLGEERLVTTSWALDALFESGQVLVAEGRYNVQTWTLGSALFFYTRFGPFTARLGAGLRVGVAAAQAPTTVESSSGPKLAFWGWPLGSTSTSWRLGRQLAFELSGEAGYVVLPLSSARGGVTVRGVWVSGQAGFAVIP